jgi:hypothetical protein
MWFRAFKKSKPDCFAPQALIGPAFSFRAAASVTREAEGGCRTSFAMFSGGGPISGAGLLSPALASFATKTHEGKNRGIGDQKRQRRRQSKPM